MGNASLKGDDRYAFNVVDVKPQSPGQRCGLMPFHDFILSVNGNMLNNMDKDEIISFIEESENKPVKLKVHNRARSDTREVTLLPTRKWPGDGLLGITIRLEKYHEGGSSSGGGARVGRRSSQQRAQRRASDSHSASRDSNEVDYDDIYKFESPLGRRQSLSGAKRDTQQSGFLTRSISVNSAARSRLVQEEKAGQGVVETDTSGEMLEGQDSPLRRGNRGNSSKGSPTVTAAGVATDDSAASSVAKKKKPLSYRVSRSFVRTVTFSPKPVKQQNL